MITLKRSALPCGEAALRDAMLEYIQAMEAHKQTEGVPAPWPKHEIIWALVAAGGVFQVEDDPENYQPTPAFIAEPPIPPVEASSFEIAAAPSYEELRQSLLSALLQMELVAENPLPVVKAFKTSLEQQALAKAAPALAQE